MSASTKTVQVLIVDDEPVQRRLAEASLQRLGYRCVAVDGGRAALEVLTRDPDGFSVVILDLVMPEMSGLDVLAELGRRHFSVPVVVQTAKGGIDAVVIAMRSGAFDFVVKPASPERLAGAVADALRLYKPLGAVKSPGSVRPAAIPAPATRSRQAPDEAPPMLLSKAMRPVMETALKAATSGIPVLIEGETGVGKEWLAEMIRANGPRAKSPFVVVNCGALPATLAESILFGHERGAFTDAGERRIGKFAEANGGTLFLDEVGELPPDLQVKLLRVLQNGEVDPIGARQPDRTDVRILAATNRDLAEEVRHGRFRMDLYYRLNVLAIRVPPLRERRVEIEPLALGFLKAFRLREGASSRAETIGREALDLLISHDWAGNIRQLENAVHRAVVMADQAVLTPADFFGTLMPAGTFAPVSSANHETVSSFRANADMPEAPAIVTPSPAAKTMIVSATTTHVQPRGSVEVVDEAGDLRPIEAVEADLIRLAMHRYGGRMSEIARRLGMGRSTLYRKMHHYKIPQPD